MCTTESFHFYLYTMCKLFFYELETFENRVMAYIACGIYKNVDHLSKKYSDNLITQLLKLTCARFQSSGLKINTEKVTIRPAVE